MEIRRVNLNEVEQLQEISKQTFEETFSSANSPENMNIYLNDMFSNLQLTNELNDKNAEFYFAVFENKIIGYLKINVGESQTELKEENSLEIERIYVLQEFHGVKFGQKLFEKAIEVAKDKKVEYVWLGVWEENQIAIKFYEKNGFKEFEKHIFKLGYEEQTDKMMKLKI